MPELKMPALSPMMEKGTLAKWLVGVGDTIRAGDLIAEVETDKATMELEADEEGRISHLVVPEGTDAVPVGKVIAILASDGEAVEVPAEKSAEAPQEPTFDKVPESEATGGGEAAKPASDEVPAAQLSNGIRISPLAARIAQAKGIALDGIAGSGRTGRIVNADLGLTNSREERAPQSAAPTAPAASAYAVLDVPHELVKLTSMRKTIARRLTESKRQIPHAESIILYASLVEGAAITNASLWRASTCRLSLRG